VASDPIAHPTHRRLGAEAIGHIADLSRANVTPRAIVSSLRLGVAGVPEPLVPPIAKDVYNARVAIRLGTLAGRTPVQALMASLETSDDWTYYRELDPSGRVLALFLAHRSSIELLQGSPEILVLDCTYKTNRYRMPLLAITGVSALGSTFHVAIVFLGREIRETYGWALRGLKVLYSSIGVDAPETLVTDRDLGLMGAIRDVFPRAGHLLCQWHVQKNVLARCKRHFSSAEDWEEFFRVWRNLLASATPESYTEALGEFRAQYPRSLALAYLEKTWLPYKESLVLAWTNRTLHFGILTTSRVEGSHSVLKGYLQVSTGDLHAVAERMGLLVANQAIEARAGKARALTRIGGNLRIPLFVELIGLVSPIALRQLLEQRRKLTGDRPTVAAPCTRVFRATMGLPCSHEIADRVRAGGSLSPRDLHPYWLLNRSQAPAHAIDPALLIRDPPIATPKGRPRGALGGSRTTRREPSLFELVERTAGDPCPRATPSDREAPGF
jgi:hypothetical protein